MDDRKLSPKCIRVARPMLFGYIQERAEFEFYVNELFNLLKSGQLKVRIHKIYPLEEAAQAHRVGYYFIVILVKWCMAVFLMYDV